MHRIKRKMNETATVRISYWQALTVWMGGGIGAIWLILKLAGIL